MLKFEKLPPRRAGARLRGANFREHLTKLPRAYTIPYGWTPIIYNEVCYEKMEMHRLR